MVKLNLPEFEPKITKRDGKILIFDSFRRKNIILTPEEWVRQNFCHYLVNYRDYPRSLIKLEGGMKYNRMTKRSDILIYNQQTKPFMLIECKSFQIKINQDAFDQVSNYNQVIKARYLVVTNGLHHFYWEVDHNNKRYEILNEVPPFNAYPD